jgi:hypothetical protein
MRHALLTITLSVSLLGCGGGISQARAEGMHEVLNVVTDVADPLYEASVSTCDATEGYVVRAAESHADGEAGLAEVRAICDRIFAAFEALRRAQLGARSAVDAALEDPSLSERFVSAVTAVQELQRAAQAAKEVWATEKAALEALRGGDNG